MLKSAMLSGSALAAVVLTALFAGPAQAAERVRLAPPVAPLPDAGPGVVMEEVFGAPIQKGIPQPYISYRHHGPRRSSGTVTLLLDIQNPCTGVIYEVPVCMPDCCVGEPRVVVEKGLPNGMAIGVYVWRGGYKVKMILDRRGDIAVHTFGG